MDEETRELHPRILGLAPDARTLLAGFADAIETAQAEGGDLAHITGTASKAAEQATRIAGVLTLFADMNAQAVNAETMADAISLAQFYLSKHHGFPALRAYRQKLTRPKACANGCWKAGRILT